MINASEIAELEKKVFYYRLKKRLRYVIAFILLISLLGIIFFFYVTKEHSTFSAIAQKHEVTPAQPIILPKQELPKSSVPEDSKGLSEETLLLKSPHIVTEKTSSAKEYPLPIEEEIPSKVTPPNTLSQDKVLYRSTDETLDTSILAPPLTEDIKPKGVIKIESQEMNSVHYLKDKFEKTNNIIFALMLAEEYYLAQDYKESNKWALIANQLDADNEKSWLWFAKSKVKLGQKEDAIVALKAYIKNNKSKTAQTLLNQIYLGEIHE